jgi:hypothetical protein
MANEHSLIWEDETVVPVPLVVTTMFMFYLTASIEIALDNNDLAMVRVIGQTSCEFTNTVSNMYSAEEGPVADRIDILFGVGLRPVDDLVIWTAAGGLRDTSNIFKTLSHMVASGAWKISADIGVTAEQYVESMNVQSAMIDNLLSRYVAGPSEQQ